MLLTIDIGTGTQDILIFDNQEKYRENFIKMIFPSYSLKYFNQVKKMTGDIFIKGDPIGGGPLKKALEKHIKKGYRVAFCNNSYKTVRDSEEEVLQKGFEVCRGDNNYPNILEIKEFDINIFNCIFDSFDVSWNEIDSILIACQDHGFRDMKGTEREFRLNLFKEALSENNDVRKFLFKSNQIPKTFLRMNALAERVKKEGFEKDIYIMDTVFAACAGVTSDERFDFDSYNLILNFGNSHTLGIVVKGYNVHALFEHHTRILEKNPHFLKKIIDDFLEWNLSSKEVMDNDGHGSFYLTDSKLTIKNIFVTGPRRNIACNFEREYINASPWGDMMITGNVGLINSFNSIFS